MNKLHITQLYDPQKIKTRFKSSQKGYRFESKEDKQCFNLPQYTWRNAIRKRNSLGAPAISLIIRWQKREEEVLGIHFGLEENFSMQCERSDHITASFGGDVPMEDTEKDTYNYIKSEKIDFNLKGLLPAHEFEDILLQPLSVPAYWSNLQRRTRERLIERNHPAVMEFYRAVLKSALPVVEVEEIDAIYNYDA